MKRYRVFVAVRDRRGHDAVQYVSVEADNEGAAEVAAWAKVTRPDITPQRVVLVEEAS